MGSNEELIARRLRVTPRGLPMVTRATAVRGQGATIADAEDHMLIDFAGGIGVMTVGHGHERVVAAICEQAHKLLHTCIHVATYEPYVALCEKLAALFPHGEQTKVLLVNTGAEAVENAVKIARQATNRQAILCFTESFHGRTLLGMSLTSKVANKAGCGPFAPEVYRLPFPNFFRYNDGLSRDAFIERELTRMHQAFVNLVAPEHLAAVLIEPVQGEGGFVPAPSPYLRGLRKICDEHGILLIFDEVQTGFCRTGRWAAYEHSNVVPDLSTWAKALGGGLPIGAVIGRADIMDAARPGTVGGTFGGNPIACAAALAAIGVMEDLNLNARAEAIGHRLKSRFEEMQKHCPFIGDVRGVGAMMAIAFVEGGDPNRPATELVARIIERCVARGVLLIPAGSYAHVLRILCPLVITDAELDRGLDIVEEEVLRLTEA